MQRVDLQPAAMLCTLSRCVGVCDSAKMKAAGGILLGLREFASHAVHAVHFSAFQFERAAASCCARCAQDDTNCYNLTHDKLSTENWPHLTMGRAV